MRAYPTLELIWPSVPTEDETTIAVADLDDCHPTAVQDVPGGIRVFFSTPDDRDVAADILARSQPHILASPLSVPDEDWAERSQAALTPIRVGSIVVTPPWGAPAVAASDLVITILPSMGFGTGHHATTRLCLSLLQRHAPRGQRVLDVGTGSGVLALAAWRLGAREAWGIDVDPDALTNAQENVELNQAQDSVRLGVRDITHEASVSHDAYALTLANLTGALLMRMAPWLGATLEPGGVLITSGFQVDERDAVVETFASAGLRLLDESTEDTWVAAAFHR